MPASLLEIIIRIMKHCSPCMSMLTVPVCLPLKHFLLWVCRLSLDMNPPRSPSANLLNKANFPLQLWKLVMGYLAKMESEVSGRKSSLDLPPEVSCRPNRKRGTWSYMDLILLQDTILLQPKEETPSVGIKNAFPPQGHLYINGLT